MLICGFAQDIHRQLILIHRNVDAAEDRRNLKLTGRDFIVFSFGVNA